MTIRIEASSHWFEPTSADVKPSSLDALVAEVCRERYRRIDRFVQLALIGAGQCVARRPLERECGLYLCSGVGPIGSNLAVQVAIHHERKAPMPFSFVNSIGSSAAHYVAKDLGLSGEGTFVSRHGASFSAAVACAVADIALGVATQALVGTVEEQAWPQDVHRRLLHLDERTLLAEGSHWLLLGPGTIAGRHVDDAELADETFTGYESRDAALITSYLQRHPGVTFGLDWSVERGCQLVRAA